MDFRLHSDYQPSGDQPEAIDGLCNAIGWLLFLPIITPID